MSFNRTAIHSTTRKPKLNTIYESTEPLFADYKQKRNKLFELSKQVDDLEESETNRDIKKIRSLDTEMKALLQELIQMSSEIIKLIPEELHNSSEYSMLLAEKDSFYRAKVLINMKMYNGGRRFRKTRNNKKIKTMNRKTMNRKTMNRKTINKKTLAKTRSRTRR
jgi:hypothetical protein